MLVVFLISVLCFLQLCCVYDKYISDVTTVFVGVNCSERVSGRTSKGWWSPFVCQVSLSHSLPSLLIEDLVQASPAFNPKTGKITTFPYVPETMCACGTCSSFVFCNCIP